MRARLRSGSIQRVTRIVLLAQPCASRRLADLMCYGRRKSNDDKPRAGNNATTCKFGRMTLPVYGLTQAYWIQRHRHTTWARRRWHGAHSTYNDGEFDGRD